MKCPRCGNDVGPDEAFCGQCGTPMTQAAQPTEMVNTPTQRTGFPGGYTNNNPNYPQRSQQLPPGQGAFTPQIPPSNAFNNTTMAMPPGGPVAPHQQPQQGPGALEPQHQSGFYQDATEAMTSLPSNRGQGYPAGYQQQGFSGQGGYAGGSQYGQFGTQVSNFAPSNYPSSPIPVGQGYSNPPQPTPPPKKQTSGVLVFAIICLLVAIIAVSAFGAIYFLHNHGPRTSNVPTPPPTVAISPTTVPSPTPTPTVAPTPSPSPTIVPTPTPDANFAWCTTCTTNGFLVEYPQGWNQTNDGATTNIRFVNPGASDQYAEFKTPGATTSNASQLVANDLQTTFASQPGYTAPTGSSTATIGGENWIYEIAYYQLNGQQEQVQVYATVHQQNAYIIELQAATSQFPTVNTQYYATMLGRFQFQQPSS